MIKAVFCDFYGTVVHENGPISFEVVKRIYKNSNAQSPEEAVKYWWNDLRKRMDKFCGDKWKSQAVLALESFEATLTHFNSSEDPIELLNMMNEHWSNPPIYDDTRSFMENINLPIYFVTNSDDKHIFKAIENHDLKPTGVFTSEQARYSKTKPEIFQYALDKAGLTPNEVIHMGDSLDGDVKCPGLLGITTLWLNRDNMPIPLGITAVSNLDEALQKISFYTK